MCATSGMLAFAGVRPNLASTLFFHIYNKNWQHSRANLCVNNILPQKLKKIDIEHSLIINNILSQSYFVCTMHVRIKLHVFINQIAEVAI